jgi:hypothetical protein
VEKGNDAAGMLHGIERRLMRRLRNRCEESRFDISWVLILAALFVLAKQTCGIPTSWWWILTNIPLGMFLQNLRADR